MGGHIYRRIVSATIVTVVLLVWWRWTRPNGQGQGYVLTLEYTGQLVAGVRGLQSQQCWISSFGLPLAIVEPFLSNSTLRLDSNRDPWSQELKNNMKFHDIFDLNHFNANSDALGLPVLVSWEHFHAFAPRSVIVVTVDSVFSRGCLHFSEKTCTSDRVDEVSFAPCNAPIETERVILSLQKHNFAVVRSVCLSCLDDSLKGSPSAITKHILGPYAAGEVTILINKWKFSFILTSDCKEMCIKLQPESYIESPRVHKDTRKYFQKYFPTEKYVAVTLRMEWFLISNKEDKENTSSALKCLSEVVAAVGEYQSQLGASNNNRPFLAMDIGAYGSNTFKDTLRRIKTSEAFYNETVSLTKNFVKYLYRGLWTFKDWEESFTTIPGVVGERVYIGALQRSLASRGDCVIFMGGGHFQHMILEAYLKLHPDRSTQCIKLVCMAPPFLRLFSRIIASQ